MSPYGITVKNPMRPAVLPIDTVSAS
jgi:hypothetical protein